MKRSDLSTRYVLFVVAQVGVNAWEVLSAAVPPKVALAAIQREVDAGHLDYGVWLGRPFLTPEGSAKLCELTGPSARTYRAAERGHYPPDPCPECGDYDGDVAWRDVSTAVTPDRWLPDTTRCTNSSCPTHPQLYVEAS